MQKRIALGWIGLILFFSGAMAHAQVQSINFQTYNPSTSDRFVILEDGFRSEWPKTARFYFGANYNFVTEPFVVLNSDQTSKLYNVIDSIQTLDLMLGIKLSNNFGLFIGAPLHFVAFAAGLPTQFPVGSENAFGDLKILGKIRLTDDASNTSFALIPEVHLATGGTGVFVSDASTYVSLRAALERTFESWTLIVNLGYASASNSTYNFKNTDNTYSYIDFRKRLIAGVGGYLPFDDSWGMNFELNSINALPFDTSLAPNDAYLGFRYGTPDGLALTAGASVGRIGGIQGQDFRFIGGIRYTLFEAENKAPQPLAAPVK